MNNETNSKMGQLNTTFVILDLETGNVLDTQISKKDKMSFSFEASFLAKKKMGKMVVVQSCKDGDNEMKTVKS